MTHEELLKTRIVEAASSLGLSLSANDVVIERSRDQAHGDYASNVAMKHFRLSGMKSPRDFANALMEKISDESIDHIEIAGPGFMNFFMKQDLLQGVVEQVITQGENYGRNPKKACKINVEYVSANPTGDLHLGHTRSSFGTIKCGWDIKITDFNI